MRYEEEHVKVDLDYSQTYYSGGTDGSSGANPLHEAADSAPDNFRLDQARQMEMTAMNDNAGTPMDGMNSMNGTGTAMAMGAGAGVATAGLLYAAGPGTSSENSDSDNGSNVNNVGNSSSDSLEGATSTHNPMLTGG